MTKRLALLVAAFAILLTCADRAMADSPLTSTPFSEAYIDLEIVRDAQDGGLMSLRIAEYLSSPDVPVDAKAAVINALGWDIEGKYNSVVYETYLLLKHFEVSDRFTFAPTEEEIMLLSADELFSIGYLAAMDDYFNPSFALPWLEAAHEKKPESFTIAMILALVRAQSAMEEDWGPIWQMIEEVLDDSSLKIDMRPDATGIILDYMHLYAPESR